MCSPPPGVLLDIDLMDYSLPYYRQVNGDNMAALIDLTYYSVIHSDNVCPQRPCNIILGRRSAFDGPL